MSYELPDSSLTSSIEPFSSESGSWREGMASWLHRSARWQAHLFWWYTETIFSHYFSKTECGSLIEKILRWVKRCCWIVVALPLLSGTCVLAETELFTRISAHMVAQKPFTYLQGEGSEKIWNGKEPLTIFSLNTCFVAGGFSLFYGGVIPWSERIDAIIENIHQKNPDILCLQEVNDINAAYRLYHALKKEYCYFYLNIGPKILGQNSGLFVASKYRIQDPSFVSFEEISGVQRMVNKGFFDGKVMSGSKIIAHLFTTHLSPSQDDGSPTSAEKQVRKTELQMIFAKMKNASKGVPIIFAGDFNMERELDEASLLHEFVDPFPKGEKSSATDVLTHLLRAHSEQEMEEIKKMQSQYAIDYILYKSNHVSCKGRVSIVKSYDIHADFFRKALSDHHALFAELYFKV